MVHRAPIESNSNDEPSFGETALTRDEAWHLANAWVAAWNAHDLDRIMTHYDNAVELTSPIAAQLLGTADGKVVGKASLRIVPIATPGLVNCASSWVRVGLPKPATRPGSGASLAKPKSRILAWPWAVTKILAGFISR